MIIGKETEQIEFKLTTGQKHEAMESISAILNKHKNGTLYFGVDDYGYVKGQQISDSTIRDISRVINETIEPKFIFTIDVISILDKNIIKVSFSGNNRPYSVNGKYLIRNGTENRKMSNEDLKRLVKQDDYSSKREEELTNYSIEEVDDATLYDFYLSSTSCGRLELKSYDKEKILSMLGLVRNGFINNGCFVLFGKSAKVALKMITYATRNKIRILDLKMLTGNIYNLIDDALNYILGHISRKSNIVNRKREEIPEIPENALREIIANAFAHATYENLPEIEIGIHPDKVEIYNPGTFPENLTPYDFIEANIPSYKRNKLILDVLFRSKDVEKSGTGFQRMNELCETNKVEWSFRKEAYGFFFEFKRANVQANANVEELTKLEKRVYLIIQSNLGITKSDIAIEVGKSEKTIQRVINSLINHEMIRRVGSNKNGYWEAINIEKNI